MDKINLTNNLHEIVKKYHDIIQSIIYNHEFHGIKPISLDSSMYMANWQNRTDYNYIKIILKEENVLDQFEFEVIEE